MHYSEEPESNRSGITVFGKDSPHLFYNYDDRLTS